MTRVEAITTRPSSDLEDSVRTLVIPNGEAGTNLLARAATSLPADSRFLPSVGMTRVEAITIRPSSGTDESSSPRAVRNPWPESQSPRRSRCLRRKILPCGSCVAFLRWPECIHVCSCPGRAWCFAQSDSQSCRSQSPPRIRADRSPISQWMFSLRVNAETAFIMTIGPTATTRSIRVPFSINCRSLSVTNPLSA
jgi:hypothetical protein